MAVSERVKRFHPTPSDEELRNPHRGCCTFQRFEGDPLNGVEAPPSEAGPESFAELTPTEVREQAYPPTTVSYCRWFWARFEPREGEYDFTRVEEALRVCEARDLTLAVRLMPLGGVSQPPLPAWYASSYATRPWSAAASRSIIVPEYDSGDYLRTFGGLIRAFGRRFDGHPRLESVDMAYVGPWGEGAGDCSPAQHERFAALWREAFPRTPRLAMVIDAQLAEGVRSGSGWRCDCFGDLPLASTGAVSFGHNWSHMYDCYPHAIVAAGAARAWETAPVHLETCYFPYCWFMGGKEPRARRYHGAYDLEFTLAQGLKLHATYFMPKSTPIPAPWQARINAWCRQLGYRLVCRLVVVDAVVRRGERFRFQAWIENTGVAPLYRRYVPAVRLRQGDREAVHALAEVDVRVWLPGDAWIDAAIPVPLSLKEGAVEVSLGLLDPSTGAARVRFSNRDLFADRWLHLGETSIEAP